jgi:hypothetical protein
LPTEGHAQSHEQKKHANNPGKLSRELVSPKQKHLDHVNQNKRHHEIRAPSVHCTDEPAESHVVVQRLQAAPRLAGRRDVNQRKKNPRHELQEKYGECRAAENVKPARCVSRNRVLGGFANGSRKLQAPIEPFSDLRN